MNTKVEQISLQYHASSATPSRSKLRHSKCNFKKLGGRISNRMVHSLLSCTQIQHIAHNCLVSQPHCRMHYMFELDMRWRENGCQDRGLGKCCSRMWGSMLRHFVAYSRFKSRNFWLCGSKVKGPRSNFLGSRNGNKDLTKPTYLLA